MTFASFLEGDSHLAIAPPALSHPGASSIAAIKIEVLVEEGTVLFHGRPNAGGFLSKVTGETEATGFADAEARTYRMIAPTLSVWSAHFDIPLHVFQVESTELRTGSSRASLTMPHRAVAYGLHTEGMTTSELRSYASYYREALNANSQIYQFLCFFKIIEGIGSRRERLSAAAHSRGESLRRPLELIPDSPAEFEKWLRPLFLTSPDWTDFDLALIFPKEARGLKLNRIIDDKLRPLRVDIAHALVDDSGEVTLSADDMLHTSRVEKWLPLTRCIARRMLKNEFPQEFLRDVPD